MLFNQRHKILVSISAFLFILCVFELFYFEKKYRNIQDAYNIQLNNTVINQVIFSHSALISFVSNIILNSENDTSVYAIIPPYPCEDCLKKSLEDLRETGFTIGLYYANESPFVDIIMTGYPLENIHPYDDYPVDNSICYFSNLIFIVHKGGEIIDYYFNNTDVPEGMRIFLNRYLDKE